MDELVRQNQRRIYEVAFRFLGNHDDAADVCQKTFVRMYQKLDSFQHKAKLRTWLYRITINLCKNYVRDEKRRSDFKKEIVGFKRESAPEDINYKSAPLVQQNPRQDPSEGIFQTQRQQILRQGIEKLPKKQRAIMILRTYEELSFQEIAQTLGGSESAAKVNYHYALNNLKEILKETKTHE